MGRSKKKPKPGTALVLYQPGTTLVHVPAASHDSRLSDDGGDIVGEWGRDLLKTLEEIAPDCRVHPEARMSGRWR